MSRIDREAAGIRIEDMATLLKMPVNDLCLLEMHAMKYDQLLDATFKQLGFEFPQVHH